MARTLGKNIHARNVQQTRLENNNTAIATDILLLKINFIKSNKLSILHTFLYILVMRSELILGEVHSVRGLLHRREN